jgi:membrane protease YdiL (CAAX protease family)
VALKHPLLFLLAACLAFLLAGFLAVIWTRWLLRTGRSSWLLPPQRRRAVPWKGDELLLLLFLAVLIVPALVEAVLQGSHLFPINKDLETNAPQLIEVRRLVWTAVLAWPLQLAILLGGLRGISGTRFYQLGLFGKRLGKNLILGGLSLCALYPLIWMVNEGLTRIWQHWVGPAVPHPLARLGQAQPSALEWCLIAFSALVSAPILEELVLRGILQPWFASRRERAPLAMFVTLSWAFFCSRGPLSRVGQDQLVELLIALAPVWFVLAMFPGFEILRRFWPFSPAASIYSTALLFGVAHAAVWPTPVAMFLFGLGLGLLAYRTQSLVPAIVAHSLFNGVAVVILVSSEW